MYITDSMLTKACAGQRRKFNELFPAGVELTESLCTAHGKDFDFGWAAEHLLPEQLSAEYRRQEAKLSAEYRRQEAKLWAEYKIQKAPLWAEYRRQKEPLLAEYKMQEATLWAEYRRQCAVLFYRVASMP